MWMLGVVLIVLGIVALAYGGITYTKHEKVIDAGPFDASVDEKEHVPLPPVAGAIAVVAGILLVSRRTRMA